MNNHKTWLGFVFPDVNDDLLNESHDLSCGLILRKATREELSLGQVEEDFKHWTARRTGSYKFIDQRMPIVDGRTSDGSPLKDFSQWRHAVIKCSNPSISQWWANVALSLCDHDLRLGYFQYDADEFSNPYLDFIMLNIRSPLGGRVKSKELPRYDQLSGIRRILALILNRKIDDLPEETLKMIGLFQSLDQLADTATLKVLGYFSVIEGLLSHSPEPSDRMDSIQRQLIRNINLLNNRLSENSLEIDFRKFTPTGIEKTLKKIYAYRSAIAHGGKQEDVLKDITSIYNCDIPKNQESLYIHDWIRHMTKRLLMAAIIEPQLVRDLK